MWNRIEILRQVGVHHIGVPLAQQLVHRLDRIDTAAARSVAIGSRFEVRLEDRLQHQFRGGLHHPVPDRGYAERPLAAAQLGLKLGVISSALIGLGVNEGAYLAEIIRAGISAVPRGQFEAARAIGMTRAVTMRVVVMPQALRIIIPPLGNAFNGLMKTSSLASVISMEELLRRTELLIQVQFKVLEIFIVAALYYLVLTTLWGFVQDPLQVEARLPRRPLDGCGPTARADFTRMIPRPGALEFRASSGLATSAARRYPNIRTNSNFRNQWLSWSRCCGTA